MEAGKVATDMEALREIDAPYAASETEDGTGKIFCANCIHCKLVPSPAGGGRYHLRVRCDAGRWRKKLGDEKLHKYFTVARRSLDSCDRYEDMGEGAEFIRDLRCTLPARDELYDGPARG